MQRPSGAWEWQMPEPVVEPRPAAAVDRRFGAPLLAHDASYFAASARRDSLRDSSMREERLRDTA